MSLLFCAVSQTRLVAAHDLYKLLEPLEINAGDCARAWGLEPPAVAIADTPSRISGVAIPVVFVADDTDQGALAVHFPGGYSRVHVDRMSGFDTGDESVLNGAGHEICEALVDLDCNQWMPMPGNPALQVAKEVCDPLQDSYRRTVGGRDVDLANFVLPSWFSGQGTQFDFAGHLHSVGEVGPQGYIITQDAQHRVHAQGRVALAKLREHRSRTMRRASQRSV